VDRRRAGKVVQSMQTNPQMESIILSQPLPGLSDSQAKNATAYPLDVSEYQTLLHDSMKSLGTTPNCCDQARNQHYYTRTRSRWAAASRRRDLDATGTRRQRVLLLPQLDHLANRPEIRGS